MEAISDLSCREFGVTHFQHCNFGDARLTQRAVASASMVLKHPGGTLPGKLSASNLIGFYRLANNPKVTHQKMLHGHRQWVLEQMQAVVGEPAAPRVLLLISDTTEADFTGLESAADLGSIGNGGGRGLLCHNVLAYDYASRSTLGLANQVIHKRRDVKKSETARHKREHPQRESRLWKRGLTGLPAAPAGQLRVNICDRGSDSFENIDFFETQGGKYCIRSKSNRKLADSDAGDDEAAHRLHDLARALPRVDQRSISVNANHGQPGRCATVAVGFSSVTVPAPRNRRGEHSDQSAQAWVVHVREICDAANPRAKSNAKAPQPLEWILLTNVPVLNAGDAWERVDWYRCRPVIEEFHKAMKTGCGVELLQFTHRAALEVALALLSVVATRLLMLRDLSRDPAMKDQPATEVIDEIYVEVLSVMRFHKKQSLTVFEFFRALAYLGGHLNRTTDKPPGWLVLWRGWTKLQPMVLAVEADRRTRCV